MKKTLIIASLLVLTMCMALVSCSKDEEDQKPQTTVPSEDPDPNPDPDDLSTFDIMQHQWTLFQIESDDMDAMTLGMINQGISSGNMFLVFSGESGGPETNYAGWSMSMVYSTTPLMSFDVVSYSPATQQLEMSSNETTFTTPVQLTDASDRVMMTLQASMALTGSNMSIVAYTYKE